MTDFKRCDDSNPQQGSSTTTTTTTTSIAHTQTAARTVTPTITATSNTTNTTTMNKSQANHSTTFKIPPTKKDNRKLFVGGLPPEVTNVEFRAFFETFGEILDSIVMIDRETKCSRGFGFVTFQDSAVASRIIAENLQDDFKSKVNISGKWCEVKASEPKRGHWFNRGGGAGGANGDGGNGSGGRGRSMNSTLETAEISSSRNSSIETSSRTSTTKQGPTGGANDEVKPTDGSTLNSDEAAAAATPLQQVHHLSENQNYNYHYYPHHTAMPYQQQHMGRHNMPYYNHPNFPAGPPSHMNANMAQASAPYMYQYPPPHVPQMMYFNPDLNNAPQQMYGNYDHSNTYHYPQMTIAPQMSYEGYGENAGSFNQSPDIQQQQQQQQQKQQEAEK